MNRLRILCIIGSAIACLSCGTDRQQPLDHSQIEVRVQWEGQGLPDRRVEVRELELFQLTNLDGIALFSVPPGNYTVRALVNVGGPAGFSDRSVTTIPGERTHLDFIDCLPCVGPAHVVRGYADSR